MDRKTLIVVLGIAVVAAIIYFYSTKDRYDNNVALRAIPTNLEVEYIEGQPDYDMINVATGEQVVPSGDISLGEGFGVSSGEFGFGRSGSTFMV
jgi:hypothetical protein